MATLSPDQRNYYYLLESERTGIHQPILAALYQTHSSSSLSDGQNPELLDRSTTDKTAMVNLLTQLDRELLTGSILSLLALIPQPRLPRGEGEQDFQVPLPPEEGFRVRAVRLLAKVTYSPSNLCTTLA